MVQQLKKPARKRIKEMMPVKEWVCLNEAMAYTSLGKNSFLQVALERRLTTSVLTKKKKFYRVSELKALFETSIIVKQ